MVSRDEIFDAVGEIGDLFDSLDISWLSKLKDLLSDEDLTANQAITKILLKVRTMLDESDSEISEKIETILANISDMAIKGIFKDLKKSDKRVLEQLVLKTNVYLKKIYSKVYGDYLGMKNSMLRNASKEVVGIVNDALAKQQAGISREQALGDALGQDAIKAFSFVDNAGRNWSPRAYMEMNLRTNGSSLMREVHTETMKEFGEDLVIVDVLNDGCDICAPWEGQVLSVSGTSDKYSSMDEAEADGLHHPNCRHSESLYIEGINTEPKVQPEEITQKKYQERQEQRAIERQVRNWKKRDAVAMTEKQKAFAKQKIKDWQSKMRSFIDRTGRRREYSREKIGDLTQRIKNILNDI